MPCEVDTVHDRLTDATRAACEMGRVLYALPVFKKLSKSTQTWIEAHVKADERRIKRDIARSRALKKLTAEEREALNLND